MPNYGKYYIAVRLLLLKQYLEANAGKNRIVSRKELEAFLEEHDIGVEKKTIYATCFTVQDIFLKTVHESFLSWEAHLHFLYQNKAQNAKTGSTSPLFWGVGCASLLYFCEKWGLNFLKFKSKGFTLLLQAFLNSNSHGNGHADHGVVACAQEASEARFRGGICP